MQFSTKNAESSDAAIGNTREGVLRVAQSPRKKGAEWGT
jgi:hypothetical protein